MALSDILFGSSKNIYSAGVKGASASYNAGVRGASWALNGYEDNVSSAGSAPSGGGGGGGDGDFIVGIAILAAYLAIPAYAAGRYAVGVVGAGVSYGAGAVAAGAVGAAGLVVKGGEMAAGAVNKMRSKGGSVDTRSRSSSADSQPAVFEQTNPMHATVKVPSEVRAPAQTQNKPLPPQLPASPKGIARAAAREKQTQGQNPGVVDALRNPTSPIINPAPPSNQRRSRVSEIQGLPPKPPSRGM